MTDESRDNEEPPIKGFVRLGKDGFPESPSISRNTCFKIIDQFAISEDQQKYNLMIALTSAEASYVFEEQRVAKQVSSSELKKTIKQIRGAAVKLERLLRQLERTDPESDNLKYCYAMAEWKLLSEPQYREGNPIFDMDLETNTPIFGHPRIEQVIPYVAYIERMSEIALEIPKSGSSGRKAKTAIRFLVAPLTMFWIEDLKRNPSVRKDSPHALTEFEQFIEACTQPIAPGRWTEIKSALTHS